MIIRIKICMIAVLALLFMSAGTLSRAGDLDDGISKYKDESISDDSEMGSPDPNISFIVLDALSKANRGKKNGVDDNDRVNVNTGARSGAQSNNVNSVICETGADCSGTIININK